MQKKQKKMMIAYERFESAPDSFLRIYLLIPT